MHTRAYTGAGRAAECDIRPGGEPPARPEGPPHTPRQRLRLQNLSRSSLLTGHWSLVIGHWSLVIGHWSLVIGHWSLVSSSLLVAGHRLDGPARTPRQRLWLPFLSPVTILVTSDYR